MKCITEECKNPVENKDTGECASCARYRRKAESRKAKQQPAPIMKVSKKMNTEMQKYHSKKESWIKGKRCVVAPSMTATDVHHMKGRIGYADDWARENNIPLLIDERFWLPVSRVGHTMIETNPKWAKEMKYSLDRL